MRITFTYTKPGTASIAAEVTKRDGYLLGITYKQNTIYFHVKEAGSETVKQFIAQRISDVTTVLEPHEQMPGVLAPAVAQVPSAPGLAPAAPAASVETVKRLADLEAELLWYRSMAAALGARHA